MQDHQSILIVLADYFNGLYTGDTALLRSVFHPEAALFAQVRGQPYYKRLDDYLDGVEHRQSPEELGEAYQMKVVSLDVTHNIATAKVHVPALGFNYYNHLTLVREDGIWVIVNKVFADVPQQVLVGGKEA
ncbi:nuclear transport factor 2 family protein [Massilia niastensis]|uniref:nuclear transport factor 2 family protein n=1 Tax=Massilia niastensis TaxID=544911 RepID=UPI00037FFAF9|nr:nuclear transport factor 2 family protein [Massilia niastensis]